MRTGRQPHEADPLELRMGRQPHEADLSELTTGRLPHKADPSEWRTGRQPKPGKESTAELGGPHREGFYVMLLAPQAKILQFWVLARDISTR